MVATTSRANRTMVTSSFRRKESTTLIRRFEGTCRNRSLLEVFNCFACFFKPNRCGRKLIIAIVKLDVVEPTRCGIKYLLFFNKHTCSMYGIFIYIYHQLKPNEGKYSLHGSSGKVPTRSGHVCSIILSDDPWDDCIFTHMDPIKNSTMKM